MDGGVTDEGLVFVVGEVVGTVVGDVVAAVVDDRVVVVRVGVVEVVDGLPAP